MYLYESHLGGLYLSEEPIPHELLYCDECGDSDTDHGYIETFEELLACITYDDGFVPYTKEHLDEIREELEAHTKG